MIGCLENGGMRKGGKEQRGGKLKERAPVEDEDERKKILEKGESFSLL